MLFKAEIPPFNIAKPILVGRPDVIRTRIERAGLRLVPGENCEIVNPAKDERFKQYYETYHTIKARDGISPDLAKVVVRRSTITSSLGMRTTRMVAK